jgi:hypothetical protein
MAMKRAQKSLSPTFANFMTSLGPKAKGPLKQGGLCAGAIFRTRAFIETEQRSGSKVDQSVHIEHTFPITAVLIYECVGRAAVIGPVTRERPAVEEERSEVNLSVFG